MRTMGAAVSATVVSKNDRETDWRPSLAVTVTAREPKGVIGFDPVL